MYIVQCKEDKHFILLDNKYVICDHNTVKLEDCVAFLYGGKTYRGVVKKIGDDPEEMYHDYKSRTEVQYTIKKEATSPKKKRKSKQNLPRIKNKKTKKSVPVKSPTEILKEQKYFPKRMSSDKAICLERILTRDENYLRRQSGCHLSPTKQTDFSIDSKGEESFFFVSEKEEAAAKAEESINRMIERLQNSSKAAAPDTDAIENDDDILVQPPEEISVLKQGKFNRGGGDHSNGTRTTRAGDTADTAETYGNDNTLGDSNQSQGRYILRQRKPTVAKTNDSQTSITELMNQSSEYEGSFSAENSNSDTEDDNFENGIGFNSGNLSKRRTSNGRLNSKNPITVSVSHTSGSGVSEAGIILHSHDNRSSSRNELIQSSSRSGPKGPSEDQLFGKNYPNAKMELIEDDIWCKAELLTAAEYYSRSPCECARKLMVGTFREHAISNGVLSVPRRSRQSNRNSGPAIVPLREMLHGRAIRAIIAFTEKRMAEKSAKWPNTPTTKIRSEMQHLCRDVRKARKRATELGIPYEYGFGV
ncbi:hypothetical protein QAD02_000692 [Eretmocerus hayati]|uniref:Uncharacterized protein n=1 Tax=Eretmocerus hayati TaxID=131215 RepID=A0ACC2NES7_9HYME|nr:hypothetical protein QAD02_000692 [Eretmocerus hayati]